MLPCLVIAVTFDEPLELLPPPTLELFAVAFLEGSGRRTPFSPPDDSRGDKGVERNITLELGADGCRAIGVIDASVLNRACRSRRHQRTLFQLHLTYRF